MKTMRVLQEAPHRCLVEICRRNSAVWAKKWRGKKMVSIFCPTIFLPQKSLFLNRCADGEYVPILELSLSSGRLRKSRADASGVHQTTAEAYLEFDTISLRTTRIDASVRVRKLHPTGIHELLPKMQRIDRA